jgi:predicted NACHT family NTPase
VIDWNTYLESICKKYAQWWDSYTITDVASKNHNKQVAKSLLFDLQALTIKPDAIKPKTELLLEAREEREILNVLEGLRKYAAEHVLLIGRPGSGKSTALVRSLLEEAKKTSPQTPLRSGEGLNIAPPSLALKGVGGLGQIPVLVELRYYETSILDLITAFLHRHDPSLPIDSDRVKKLLRQGNCLLLIDGVNELPSPEARSHLQKFRQDYQQTTPMIFTTRDLGVGGDLGIDKKLEMQPLTEIQMGEFVRGYLGETGEQMLQQLGGRLREFGETPLLLWMLCSVFASNGNQIPANLGSVFRVFTEIYDGQLKQDIPVTDESRRWWKRLLQHLAWVMMTPD